MRNKNRLCALFLTVLLALQLAAPAFAEGETVTIRTAEDLLTLSQSCSLDSWSKGKTVVLANDISLASVDFLPIPTFGGTFDGGGHTVSGLELDGKISPAGLFGVVQEGAQVKNLNVSGEVTPSGGTRVGGVAGENRGLLSNCSFTGSAAGDDWVGGVVGLNALSGKVENCSASGSVTGRSMTGGVAGENRGVLFGCGNRSYVNITSLDPGIDLSGLEFSADLLTLRSLDAANIATDTGGVAGFSSGMILSCTNDALVGCPHVGYNVGGIAGRSSGFLSGCVNRGEVRGRKDVGGIVGQAEPYIVLDLSKDTVEQLRGQLDELERLVDRTVDDAQGTSDDVSNRLTALNDSLDGVRTRTEELTSKLSGYGGEIVGEVDRWGEILSDAMNRLTGIAEEGQDLAGKLTGSTGQLERAVRELARSGDYADGVIDELEGAADRLADAGSYLEDGLEDVRSGLNELSGAVKVKDAAAANAALDRLAGGVGKLGEAANRMGEALEFLSQALPGTGGGEPDLSGLSEGVSALREASNQAGQALGEIGGGLTSLRDNFSFDLSVVRPGLQEIGRGMDDLAKAAGEVTRAARRLKDALKSSETVVDQLQTALDTLGDAMGTLGDASADGEDLLAGVRDLTNFLASADPVQIAYPDDVLGQSADGLYGALEDLGDRLDALNAAGSAWSGRLSADLRLVNGQFNTILNTLLDTAEDASGGGEETFTDASEADVGAVTSGKILSCVNRGGVSGDLCAGGVAGAMGVEVELDPEDDNLFSDAPIYRRAYELKVILQSCVNEGKVEARRDWAGGLCGRMSLGLILDCEGYGQISSESGDYVGGVAGFSAGSIRDCWSKCVLSGGRYVGGIAGSAGVEGSGEGGSVTGCVSFVRAAEYERDAGAVSGADLGEFRENVFVSQDLAGLGRVSLAGQAEPISYEQMLALEGLPAPFRQLTVRFLAQDRVVRTVELPYGGSLSAKDFPEAPERAGQYAVWDAGDLTKLTFDVDVTAAYAPFLTALASAQTRSDGRPVLFAEGQFSGGDEVAVTAVPADAGIRGETERWEITLPRDGAKVHTLRYLSPNGSPEGLEVYQLESGLWVRLEAETVGSYLVFDVKGQNPTVVVAAKSGNWWVWLAVGFGIVALVLVCRSLAGWLKSRKKKAHDPKGRRGRLLRLAGAALALLVGAGVCLIASGLLDRLAAVRVLDSCLKQEEFSLDLSVQASAGEERWSTAARLTRVPLEGKSVTAIRQLGAAVYCSGGSVYLENGAALPLDAGTFPDYGSLLDRARELYRRGKVSVFSNGSEKIYSLTLEEQDLSLPLLPETVPIRLERLEAALTARSGKLTGLTLEAAGELSGGQAASLTAALTALDSWEAPEIPEAARTAILAGETGDREDSAGLRRLLGAWVSLNLRDPLSAQIELSADCGPLVVHDRLELFRAWTAEKQVICLRRAGKDAYLSDGKLYDAEGNALELEDGEAGPEEREALLELVWRLCLAGTAECAQEKEGVYRYTLALSGADLEEAAGAILPKAGALGASLTGGHLEVLVEDGEIARVELSCAGSLRVALADVEARLDCGMSFQTQAFSLPEAVADAVGRGG